MKKLSKKEANKCVKDTKLIKALEISLCLSKEFSGTEIKKYFYNIV